VKAVELPFMLGVCCPSLAAVQECAEDACLVYIYFGLYSETFVVPHSLVQFSHETTVVQK